MEQILLGIGLVIICLLAVKAPKLFRTKTPVHTAQAKVVSRRGEMPDKSYSNFRGTPMDYYVTFSLEGEPLELRVNGSQYTQLVEGMQGELSWQDKNLLSFKAESL